MNFSFLMDIAILVLLAATVFLAGKLTFSLRNFKESRFEMEGLVNRLTANIDKSERAIGGLQNAARNAGKELDEVIRDAKALADELKFMNETGNNLANRLEKLAEKNRELIEKANEIPAMPITYRAQLTAPAPSIDRELEEELIGGFTIQDREYDEGLEDDDLGAPGLQSQAERELFEALQSGRNRLRKTQGGRT